MALFKVYMHLKYLIMSWNDLCMFISKAFKWNNNLFEYFWIIIQTVLASFDVIGFIILAPKTLLSIASPEKNQLFWKRLVLIDLTRIVARVESTVVEPLARHAAPRAEAEVLDVKRLRVLPLHKRHVLTFSTDHYNSFLVDFNL